ncbi:hypothetical protein BH11PSE13_BH11PSE13_12720 [soil metagenome]
MKSTNSATQPIAALLVTMGLFAASANVLAAPGAQPNAQGTWRCGNTYTDQPCKGGNEVKVDDSRSEADRRAADAATRRNERRADELEHSRLGREKAASEADRRAAADARRNAIAERKLASAEKLQQARLRKLATEPRKSTQTFKGPAKP